MVVIVASESGSGNSFATSRTAASLASMPASCIIILPPSSSSSSSFEEMDCVAGGKKGLVLNQLPEHKNAWEHKPMHVYNFQQIWFLRCVRKQANNTGGNGRRRSRRGRRRRRRRKREQNRSTSQKHRPETAATVVQNANCSRSSIWFERQKSVHFPRHLRCRSRTFPKCDEEQCLKKFHCRSSFTTSLCVSPLFSPERYVCSLGLLWVPVWDQPQKWPYKRPKYPFCKANGPTNWPMTPTEVVAG